MPEPNEILTQFYSAGPYNFQAETLGPVRVLLVAAGELIADAQDAIVNFSEQIVLATATGAYLRNMAVSYGITPFHLENDTSLRARCFAALNAPKITPIALEALITQWFAANGTPPVPTAVQVIDLQNDPTTANNFGMVAGQFLVLLSFYDGPDGAFCDFSYCDYSYAGLGPYSPPSALRKLLEQQWKAACYQDIWFAAVDNSVPIGFFRMGDSVHWNIGTSLPLTILFDTATGARVLINGAINGSVSKGTWQVDHLATFTVEDTASINMSVSGDVGDPTATWYTTDSANFDLAGTLNFNISNGVSKWLIDGGTFEDTATSACNFSISSGGQWLIYGAFSLGNNATFDGTVNTGGILEVRGTFAISDNCEFDYVIEGSGGRLLVPSGAALTIGGTDVSITINAAVLLTIHGAISWTSPSASTFGNGVAAFFDVAIAGLQITCTSSETYTDGSTGSIATYAWDFGDSLGTSSAANPVYTYGSAGTYTVTLTVTTSGSASSVATFPVTVS